MVNLSYFGLLPHALGRGMGRALLRHAVETAWAGGGTRAMTVNTCTADHPRALPNYLAAGFRPVRAVREVWQVPHAPRPAHTGAVEGGIAYRLLSHLMVRGAFQHSASEKGRRIAPPASSLSRSTAPQLCASTASSSSATMLVILIIGFTAGPAVSL